MNRISTAGALLCIGAGILSTRAVAAMPTNALDAVVYAGQDIKLTYGGNLSGAPTVAGGDLVTNFGSLEVDGLYLGGSFLGGGIEDVFGDVVAVGDVVDIGGPGRVVSGQIFSGGNVSTEGSITVGNGIRASGNVTQPFSISTINGGVVAGGDVNLTGDVVGNVVYGGTFTDGPFTDITGTVSQGGPVAPPVFNTPTLPKPHNIVAGATDITLGSNQDITLAPGAYGILTYDRVNTVTLTAGTYIFDDIRSDFGLNRLAFDTSNGPIKVLIDGAFQFIDLIQVINGEPLFTGGNPDPADAAEIWFESTGTFYVEDDLYGTVYAPNGDIVVGTFADVTGSLIAGKEIRAASSLRVDFVRSSVPEPGAAMLLGLGALGVLRRRR